MKSPQRAQRSGALRGLAMDGPTRRQLSCSHARVVCGSKIYALIYMAAGHALYLKHENPGCCQ